MSQEVEIKLQQLDYSEPSNPSLAEGLRRMLLIGIGTAALTRDEVENFVKKLVDRGELAQRDAERWLRTMQARTRGGRPQLRGRFEEGVGRLLDRLNIPSKQDIADLQAKIAQLSDQIEELRKNTQGPSQGAGA